MESISATERPVQLWLRNKTYFFPWWVPIWKELDGTEAILV